MSSDDNLSPDEDDLEIIQEPEDVELTEPVNDVEIENVAENQNEVVEAAPPDDTNKKEPKVKRVRNPQPKLNAERLRGPRGLVALEDIFKNVKFKGPKHEEEDLNLLMQKYEYWAHRLFPKFPFDNSLERLEKLGNTKAVQTYIKRIRLNLLLDDEPVLNNIDDDSDDNETPPVVLTAPPDEFDNLLPQALVEPTQSTNSDSAELSEEQLERIRLNRERAQQRRKQMFDSQLSQNITANLSQNEDIIRGSESIKPGENNGLESTEPAALSQISRDLYGIRSDDGSTCVEPAIFSQASQDLLEIRSDCFDSALSQPNHGLGNCSKSLEPAVLSQTEQDSAEIRSEHRLQTSSDLSEIISNNRSRRVEPTVLSQTNRDLTNYEAVANPATNLEQLEDDSMSNTQLSTTSTSLENSQNYGRLNDVMNSSTGHTNDSQTLHPNLISVTDSEKIIKCINKETKLQLSSVSVVDQQLSVVSEEARELPGCVNVSSEMSSGVILSKQIVCQTDSPMDVDST